MKRFKFVRTPDPVYVEDEDEAQVWADRYHNRPAVGFDTETTGLHKTKARIKFFSFSDGDSRICAPVRLLPYFEPVLEDPEVEKRTSNAKFDMHMSANHGILIRGLVSDSIPMDHLLDENRKGRHGLKETCKDRLGLRMAPFKEVFGDIGSTDKEVAMVTTFHDVLESGDSDAAADALIMVGKADGDETVLKNLRKLSLSKQSGYIGLQGRKLVDIGRKHGLMPKTGGKQGYVSDFLFPLWGHTLSDWKERAAYAHLLEDRELNAELTEFFLGQLRAQVQIDLEPLEMLKLLVGDYASLDAWGSFTLVDWYMNALGEELMDSEDEYTLADYYVEKGRPYTRVLWNMERRGFAFDVEQADAYRKPMGKQIDKIERDMVATLGRDINMKSPDQMRDAFYSKDSNGDWIDLNGNPPEFWTKGGSSGVKQPSTSKDAIEKWADQGIPLAVALQEHRTLSKLHDTYLVGVPEWVDHRRRIHTDLKQHGTVTFRLSSGDPNLQNIPAKGEWGERLRKLFVAGVWGDCSPYWCLDELLDVPVPDLPPDQEMTLIVADYEQLEMRIMAHFAQDRTMIDTILDDKDLHSMTASLAGGYDYDEISEAKNTPKDKLTKRQKELIDIRGGFKAVGFGLIYGIGAVKLGRQLGLPIEESYSKRSRRTYEKCPQASKLIDQYFDIYPDVHAFIENTKEWCREDLFVQTIAGRFRRLPDIISSDGGVRSQAERQSVNSIIQGSAADIAIEAMLKCEMDPILRGLGVRMLLQIHDELVFEVPKIPELIEKAKKRIRFLMEDPYDMLVPIRISMDQADSWGEAK